MSARRSSPSAAASRPRAATPAPRRAALATVLAVACLAVAACGSSSSTSSGGKVVTDTGVRCVQPTGIPTAAGKPAAPKVDAQPPTGQIVTNDLVKGNGTAAEAGKQVKVQFFVISCTTGKQLFSTWDSGGKGPEELTLKTPDVIPGWVTGLAGMKVGGQRQLTIPAESAAGSAGGALAGGGTQAANDTVIYVIQLDDVTTAPATTTTTAPSTTTTTAPTTTTAQVTPTGAGGCVDWPVSGPITAKPVIQATPGGPVPATLQKKDIIVGTGAEAKAGDTVTMQYTGLACSTAKQFDSSWDRGQPFTAQLSTSSLIKGWVEGVPGMKVGGRRVLVIPPGEAYGAAGSPPDIGPNETLFFVVDLVKVGSSSSSS